MIDLFGLELPEPRILDRKEAAALLEVLKALRAHPAVAWCERMNSGAARIGRRFVRFGWPGCPDILGQLRDGRVLAVEVKAPRGRLRPEQTIFLELVRDAGGLAFVARDLRDVHRELSPKPAERPIVDPEPAQAPRWASWADIVDQMAAGTDGGAP